MGQVSEFALIKHPSTLNSFNQEGAKIYAKASVGISHEEGKRQVDKSGNPKDEPAVKRTHLTIPASDGKDIAISSMRSLKSLNSSRMQALGS